MNPTESPAPDATSLSVSPSCRRRRRSLAARLAGPAASCAPCEVRCSITGFQNFSIPKINQIAGIAVKVIF
jgi:hypothetical protein